MDFTKLDGLVAAVIQDADSHEVLMVGFMNEEALAQLRCEKRLEIVPGATHLFEEPGTLDDVARMARDWFRQHLRRA